MTLVISPSCVWICLDAFIPHMAAHECLNVAFILLKQVNRCFMTHTTTFSVEQDLFLLLVLFLYLDWSGLVSKDAYIWS